MTALTVAPELDAAPVLAPRCARRAEHMRRAVRLVGITGQHPYPPGYTAEHIAESVGTRLAWDAWAAGEYPRPLYADAVDAEHVRPDLAADVWHAAAGACIVGPSCDCAPPAVHRDRLMDLARTITHTAGPDVPPVPRCFVCHGERDAAFHAACADRVPEAYRPAEPAPQAAHVHLEGTT